MKILGAHLHSFVAFAVLRGMSREHAFGKFFDQGLDLTNEIVHVSRTDFQSVVKSIALTLDDELLGVHVGHSLDFSTLFIVHKISLKVSTIEEGLYYCQAYLQKTFPYVKITNTIQGKQFSISVSISDFEPPVGRIILETILTTVTRELSLMWGRDNNIATYSPFCDERYPHGWGRGNEFKVICRTNILPSTMKDYSKFGLEVLVPSFLRLVELAKSGESLRGNVKCVTLALASPELPSIDRVAYQFNCNVRTFQRRLEREGFTYRELLGEIRAELSDMLIRHDRFSIGDISNVLGYSEPAAFIRNFRKWHGSSPLQYRRACL